MGNRLPNPRLVKLHRNYSVEEIARLFGLHKNTVRHWLKQGLAAIDDRRPRLVLGSNLSRFLQERRLKGKQPCEPGRIYCVACRAPKAPAGQMAECIPTGPRTGESARHLPQLRPAHLPARQSRENRCRARRTGDHVHAAALTHRRERCPLREL
jgi:Helix-turn-helix domain